MSINSFSSVQSLRNKQKVVAVAVVGPVTKYSRSCTFQPWYVFNLFNLYLLGIHQTTRYLEVLVLSVAKQHLTRS